MRYGGEESVGELSFVELPELVELMREREDHVMVWARQKTLFPSVKPLFFGQPTALRTRAVSTGVVSDLVEVPFRTTVDVPTEFASATMDDGPRSARHVRADAILCSEAGVVLLEQRLKRDCHD